MAYIPYGEDWIKEMSKLPKDTILRMFSKMGIEKNQEYQQLKKTNNGKENDYWKKRCEAAEAYISYLANILNWPDRRNDKKMLSLYEQWQQLKSIT